MGRNAPYCNVSCITLLSSMLAGILVVALPTMARDIGLSDALLLWPASVSALSCGCTLLLSGSIADVVGGRKMYLVGVFCLTLTTIACGVGRTGIQIILFRAVQGVAISMPPLFGTSHYGQHTYRDLAQRCICLSRSWTTGRILSWTYHRRCLRSDCRLAVWILYWGHPDIRDLHYLHFWYSLGFCFRVPIIPHNIEAAED